MNREIKFRAWSNVEMTTSDEYASMSDFWLDCCECEIMQYTGLKDKHGKEIYEGDIIADTLRDIDDNIYVCEFISEGAKYVFCSPLDGDTLDENIYANDMVIIGNIYENPELLK